MPVTIPPSDRSDHLEHLTPKSLLRHRPIAPHATHAITQEPLSVPRALRASRTQTQAQRPAPKQTPTRASIEVPPWKQASKTNLPVPMFPSRLLPGMAVGMVLAVVLVLLAQLLMGWLGNTWNDLHYGNPRTFQIDAVVGHEDSVAHPSHFIALNLHGQIDIVEFPAGKVSQARVYVGPQLSGPKAALVPVTLRFITPPRASLPNMVVIVGNRGSSSQFIFVNAQGAFVSPGTTSP